MIEPYIGQIVAYPFTFPPRGWARCDGQLLQISQNTALFSLIGTQYGGNGQTNFALPNLNATRRAVAGQGHGPGLTPRVMGETIGSSSVTLLAQQMPAHTHAMTIYAGATGATAIPATDRLLVDPLINGFAAPPGNSTLTAESIALEGGGQGHNNEQPYLGLLFCIALTGIYPA